MSNKKVRIGLFGAGRIATFHAESLGLRIPNCELIGVADPVPGAAKKLADVYGAKAYENADELINSSEIDAVVIGSSAKAHTDLIVAAAKAGKQVWCEKPMAMTLEDADRAIKATDEAGVILQVGFNRRFAKDFRAAHDVIASGGIGEVQLMRSLTRDPGLSNPGGVPPWTIFRETLIHDFDALNWFANGAKAVEVFAQADALVAPDFKKSGLLDTSIVLIKYDNGALATAEANFSAKYGYDVRGEIFGSKGMVSAGDIAVSSMRHFNESGIATDTSRGDTKLFIDAYTAELQGFVNSVANKTKPYVDGRDARAALEIAMACIKSIEEHRPVAISEVQPK